MEMGTKTELSDEEHMALIYLCRRKDPGAMWMWWWHTISDEDKFTVFYCCNLCKEITCIRNNIIAHGLEHLKESKLLPFI